MDIFDFEELIADMLDITDQQREDDAFVEDAFFRKFEIDFDAAYLFAQHLLLHTPKVEAGLTKTIFHAFVSKTQPVMLMKVESEL